MYGMPSSHGILSMVKSNVKTIVCIFVFVFAQSYNFIVVSSAEYNSVICEEYNKRLVELGNKADDPSARKLHFKIQLAWYE